MYKIYVDGSLFCHSGVQELAVDAPTVKLKENACGSFSFRIPPTHPKYSGINSRKSRVKVYVDDYMVFSGWVTAMSRNLRNLLTVECEGDLTALNDSVVAPRHRTGMTVQSLLNSYLYAHNQLMPAEKDIGLGTVSVATDVTGIDCYSNYETTLQCIMQDVVDDFGGYLNIAYKADGSMLLDYLSDPLRVNNQPVTLYTNLLDVQAEYTTADLCTAIVPLGAPEETTSVAGINTRVNIKSVNSGSDAIIDQTAVNKYGLIYKTVVFDDVTSPSYLKTKGQRYLDTHKSELVSVTVTAADLGLAVSEFNQYRLHDLVHVKIPSHGIDLHEMITAQTLYLNNPAANTITIGSSLRKDSMSASKMLKA